MRVWEVRGQRLGSRVEGVGVGGLSWGIASSTPRSRPDPRKDLKHRGFRIQGSGGARVEGGERYSATLMFRVECFHV